jgi:ribosomal protein S1
VRAEVIGKAPKGLRIRVYGLNGLLPFGRMRGVKRTTPPHVIEARVQGLLGEQLEVNVLQLDADRGTVIVSEHVSQARQLRLPLT